MTLLEVQHLNLTLSERSGVRLVNDVSFEVSRGELVGLVGESGSGKSLTALAILGLLPPGVTAQGRVVFDGKNLLGASHKELRSVRGNRIGLVFQDPMSSLNPSMRIGAQIAEPLVARGVRREAARKRAVELLEQVGIARASERMDAYPHEFSGGMLQRSLIAISLVGDPDIIIADEPTTGLDVRIQAQVLDLLHLLATEREMAVLLISHDLSVVTGLTSRVLVMYAGRIVESCTTEQLASGACTHPYTKGLLLSLPRLEGAIPRRLASIPGQPPSPHDVVTGCAFHPRCQFKEDICMNEVPALVVRPPDDHECACHFAGQSLRAAEPGGAP